MPSNRVPVDRWLTESVLEPTPLRWGAAQARSGVVPILVGPCARLCFDDYAALRNDLGRRRSNVKIVAVDGGLAPTADAVPDAVLEDVGVLRAIPGLSVFAPADAPSAVAALRAAVVHDGPVYLRLPPGDWPVVTAGTFAPGKANALAEGTDLAMLAYGPLVAQALRATERLGTVGVRCRVLDCGSLKPFDEKAIIRAARETGALLTIEDHTPLTGLAALVAATTSPELPVPVRSMGIPDLFPEPRPGEGVWESVGLGLDSVVDEAWELLRLRGKVQ